MQDSIFWIIIKSTIHVIQAKFLTSGNQRKFIKPQNADSIMTFAPYSLHEFLQCLQIICSQIETSLLRNIQSSMVSKELLSS